MFSVIVIIVNPIIMIIEMSELGHCPNIQRKLDWPVSNIACGSTNQGTQNVYLGIISVLSG